MKGTFWIRLGLFRWWGIERGNIKVAVAVFNCS